MTADVCVLVEGTYPYVSGGVSNWIHSLIGNLPQFTFSVVYLGSRPEQQRELVYTLPENVVEFRELFIHDTNWTRYKHPPRHDPALWSALREYHHAQAAGSGSSHTDISRQLCAHIPGASSSFDLFFAPQSWDMIVDLYSAHAAHCSFVDYFWTFRFTHLPILYLLEVDIPRARVYHAISAGYNALLGGLAKIRTGAPLLLTEHGIYTREREIEIAQLDWIQGQQQSGHAVSAMPGYFHRWWVDMFRYLTTFSYDLSDRVISITEANQHYQLQNGADPEKMMVIPNGIDIERLSMVRAESRGTTDRFVVGFVGRVVGIKDLKTFVRAIKIASAVIPDLVTYIVGPEGEDPEYATQCHQLVETLGLSDTIEFTGPRDVCDYYRLIDVLVLTSLSEAQPLVILEANCAGIPVIATDVGACRELLLGITAEDQALGASGLITPPAHPQATADALIRLWRDGSLRAHMSRAGQERVRRFYRQETLYAAYEDLYQRYMYVSPTPSER